MTMEFAKQTESVESGTVSLGIEFGSTNIKAVLIDEKFDILASGAHAWENNLVDGLWSYSLEDVKHGLQQAYANLDADVESKYGVHIKRVQAVGISAMMHGYLAFDAEENLLVPFRTWRNTNTGNAVEKLSEVFDFNIPHRWSIAHLYQAVLDNETHVRDIAHLNTLAGYVHWLLSGERVLGIGDASGMFPIDSATRDYNQTMVDKFEELTADQPWKLRDLLPQIKVAGEQCGLLTEEGARLLDPSGNLEAGAVMCAPEGDAGTGMVATNAVSPRTGNVSTGTSIFGMVVLEQPLSKPYAELDMVTTPAGDDVAMVHCNNGASELGEWAAIFADFAKRLGGEYSMSDVFQALLESSVEADSDGGGLMFFNYLAGEPITGLDEGRPMFFRTPQSSFTLSNFVRVQLYAILATLRIGMEILENEGVGLDLLVGHGGFFKTAGVGQNVMANALRTKVSVSATASNGGAWGIAVLAAYAAKPEGTLSEYLNNQVFATTQFTTAEPKAEEMEGFDAFLARYRRALAVQQAAVENS
ncbi:MAG: FGGY-family carbohydrate kinase [Actinomycetaceae bacterium]|nr:FGGY-family carbohydrate kinase [Actinomycetaceae bacterium]